MADEITKEEDPIQAEPVGVNVEVPSGENTTPLKETPPTLSGEVNTTPPVPLSGEAETSAPTVIQIPVDEPKEAEIPNTPPPSGHLPLAGEEKTSAPVVAQTPVAEPKLTPVVASIPEPSPIVSEPVAIKPTEKITPPTEVASSATEPTAPPSKMDRVIAAFKNNMMRARELLVKAHAVVSARRRKKIDSIMNLFLKKKKIKNSDVRDFLHIAEDTVTDYLNILLKEGKIKRNGKSTGIYYTKV